MRQRTIPVEEPSGGRTDCADKSGAPPCASGAVAGELERGQRWPACVDAPLGLPSTAPADKP